MLPLRGKILNVEKARFDKMLSSQEVGTLVTALGCGIGNDEFDLTKLRYHWVIIMTDADVDGSHIRTLLLTFFYRQMPELIEHGHVFIAQPPLYRVKRGRQEQYVKDDDELDDYFLQSALEQARLYVNADAPAMLDASFEDLARRYQDLMRRLEALARVYPVEVTRVMLDLPRLTLEDLGDEGRVREWADQYAERLNGGGNGNGNGNGRTTEVQVRADPEYAIHYPVVVVSAHGGTEETALGQDFFRSAEYAALCALADDLDGLLEEGAFIARGERRQAVTSFADVYAWMHAEARRGVDLSRYKGLGEMNPEHLWETTMDPEVRRMLRVTVDDAIEADRMFTTLMGDRVEPRREFIESNARLVVNLDV